jgi:hypothetical protein
MVKRWYVTATMRPDTPLAGPYATLRDAETACLARAAQETAIAALVARRLPGHYVPRQFETRVEAVHYIGAPARGPAPSQPARPAPILPPVVYAYTRTMLRTLCLALQLPGPPPHADRAAILAHIEHALEMLGW